MDIDLAALRALERERDLSLEVLIPAIEQALLTAYHRTDGSFKIARVELDPRLTTPKPWRDVFRYDEATGRRIGWIRHQAGRTHWFDAEGRLLPDGPKHPEKAVPVNYEGNAQGLLEWR